MELQWVQDKKKVKRIMVGYSPFSLLVCLEGKELNRVVFEDANFSLHR